MATAPVKSQPLHNFTFPFLKWGNHGGVTDQRRVSPELESDSDPRRNPRVGSRSARVHRLAFTSKSIRQHRKHREVVESTEMGEDAQVEAVAPPPAKLKKQAASEEKAGNEAAADEEEEEAAAKRPWNLRPRKSEAAVTVTVEKQPEIAAVAAPKSMRLRGIAENGGGAAEKEKRRFWIALSKDEINEDIYAMTESMPNRRPRKRPRNIQKQLDSIFPGLWLVGASADDLRIADSPVKK